MNKSQKKSGGKRPGAGRKPKTEPNPNKRTNRTVKLNDSEHKFIVNKYGGLSKAVQTLLPKRP